MNEGNPIGMMERGEKVVTVAGVVDPGSAGSRRTTIVIRTSPVELNEPLRFVVETIARRAE